MEDCIFCKIVAGESPMSKVYEDELVLGFMNIFPINKGHVLLIPKKHYKLLAEVPDETLGQLISAVKKVGPVVQKATGADGYNVGQNNGAAAGQIVPHVHFHIIPRFDDDGLNDWPHKEYSDGEMDEFKEKVLSAMNE